MLKPTAIDISETNMANFGTDLEYKIKLASAEGEPAFAQFLSADTITNGITVWRVHNFKLERVAPGDDVANFFRGDSYVVLSTEGTRNAHTHSIHFWIGSETTADEAGTAAYKTFELDNILTSRSSHGANVVQVREVCGAESEEFHNYFPDMRILAGGYDSGFNHVTDAQYKTRLLQVVPVLIMNKLSAYNLVEVPCEWSSLTSDGAFIYDEGTRITQYCGEMATIKTKSAVAKAVRFLDDSRGSDVKINIVDTFNKHDELYIKFANALGVREILPVSTVKTVTRTIAIPVCPHVKYADGKFSPFDPRTTSAVGSVIIRDSGNQCNVLLPAETSPMAVCQMIFAYFTKIHARPTPTKFVRWGTPQATEIFPEVTK